MKIRFSARTDTGRRREINEDSYLVDKKLRLFMVCDGMGGHAAGEVASSMAVRIVREALAKQSEQLGELADGTPSHRAAVQSLLRQAVRLASHGIYKQSQSDDDLRGMGTTLTLMLVLGQRAFVAHVGDSRLYLKREDVVHQITTDHSMVNQLILSGDLDPEEAASVPYSGALTRAVGIYPDVDVDTNELDLLPGDLFLLCSDGLHGYFTDDGELDEGLAKPFDEAADWFVAMANEAGGKDNITGILVEILEVADDQKTARLRLTLDTLRQIPLFRHLTYAELVRVINASRAREVKPSDVIIRQGDEGDALYIVLEGQVSVEQNGRQVAMLGAGGHFGEMSLVDNEPRSATVLAVEPTQLIRMVRKDFYDLLRQDSVLAVKLLWNFIQTLSARLRAVAPEVTTVATEEITEVLEDSESDHSFGYEAYAKTDPSIAAMSFDDLDG